MNPKRFLVYLSCFVCLATFCIGQTAVLMPQPKIQFLNQNGVPLAGGCVNTYAAGTTTNQQTFKDSTGGVVNANPVILDSAGRASIFLSRGVLYKFVVTSFGGANCSTGTLQYTQDNVALGSNLTIGGANTQVQFNSAGAFGGSPNFTWNNATQTLSVGALNTTSGGTLAGIFGGNPTWTGNHIFSGNPTFSGNPLFSGSSTFSASAFFKLRPWYDVMGYGAVNDGATDDSAAIQSAVTAACANGGGYIFFPSHLSGTTRYKVSGATISIPCDNLTFGGSPQHPVANGPPNPDAYIDATALNAPVFQTSGGTRNGIVFENLGILGSTANASEIGIQGVSISGWLIRSVYIQNMGGPCVQIVAGGNGGKIEDSFFTSCIAGNSTVDTGAIDINQADVDLVNTYVDCGITGTGNIGTGHTYAIALKSSSGTSHLMNVRADECQHGILLASSRNEISGGRAFHNQGNGMLVSGSSNLVHDFTALGNSQSATGGSSAFKITGTANLFSGNLIQAAGGDTNLQLNGFDDTNSNGPATDDVGNEYVANRTYTTDITGSLYNLTGTSGGALYRVFHPSRNATQTTSTGSITFKAAVDANVEYFNTALTGNVTVTLSTTGAWNGARFRVVRGPSATGAFNLTIAGIALTTAKNWADFEFLGGAWTEIAGGTMF